jgi:ethanolamine ammonia-lyase small subunit
VSFDLDRARRTTPARLDVGRAGARPRTATLLAFQHDHAAARDAVWHAWSDAFLAWLRAEGFVVVASAAVDRADYVQHPDHGRVLSRQAIDTIGTARASIQVVLSDGLSPRAAERHFPAVWAGLGRHLARIGASGRPIAVRNGRVAVGDPIGMAVGADVVVHLIGERPGLGTPDSLGCYLTWSPGPTTTDADRKCISNIHPRGLDPSEAGATIAGTVERILAARSSGVDLVL